MRRSISKSNFVSEISIQQNIDSVERRSKEIRYYNGLVLSEINHIGFSLYDTLEEIKKVGEIRAQALQKKIDINDYKRREIERKRYLLARLKNELESGDNQARFLETQCEFIGIETQKKKAEITQLQSEKSKLEEAEIEISKKSKLIEEAVAQINDTQNQLVYEIEIKKFCRIFKEKIANNKRVFFYNTKLIWRVDQQRKNSVKWIIHNLQKQQSKGLYIMRELLFVDLEKENTIKHKMIEGTKNLYLKKKYYRAFRRCFQEKMRKRNMLKVFLSHTVGIANDKITFYMKYLINKLHSTKSSQLIRRLDESTDHTEITLRASILYSNYVSRDEVLDRIDNNAMQGDERIRLFYHLAHRFIHNKVSRLSIPMYSFISQIRLKNSRLVLLSDTVFSIRFNLLRDSFKGIFEQGSRKEIKRMTAQVDSLRTKYDTRVKLLKFQISKCRQREGLTIISSLTHRKYLAVLKKISEHSIIKPKMFRINMKHAVDEIDALIKEKNRGHVVGALAAIIQVSRRLISSEAINIAAKIKEVKENKNSLLIEEDIITKKRIFAGLASLNRRIPRMIIERLYKSFSQVKKFSASKKNTLMNLACFLDSKLKRSKRYFFSSLKDHYSKSKTMRIGLLTLAKLTKYKDRDLKRRCLMRILGKAQIITSKTQEFVKRIKVFFRKSRDKMKFYGFKEIAKRYDLNVHNHLQAMRERYRIQQAEELKIQEQIHSIRAETKDYVRTFIAIKLGMMGKSNLAVIFSRFLTRCSLIPQMKKDESQENIVVISPKRSVYRLIVLRLHRIEKSKIAISFHLIYSIVPLIKYTQAIQTVKCLTERKQKLTAETQSMYKEFDDIHLNYEERKQLDSKKEEILEKRESKLAECVYKRFLWKKAISFFNLVKLKARERRSKLKKIELSILSKKFDAFHSVYHYSQRIRKGSQITEKIVKDCINLQQKNAFRVIKQKSSEFAIEKQVDILINCKQSLKKAQDKHARIITLRLKYKERKQVKLLLERAFISLKKYFAEKILQKKISYKYGLLLRTKLLRKSFNAMKPISSNGINYHQVSRTPCLNAQEPILSKWRNKSTISRVLSGICRPRLSVSFYTILANSHCSHSTKLHSFLSILSSHISANSTRLLSLSLKRLCVLDLTHSRCGFEERGSLPCEPPLGLPVMRGVLPLLHLSILTAGRQRDCKLRCFDKPSSQRMLLNCFTALLPPVRVSEEVAELLPALPPLSRLLMDASQYLHHLSAAEAGSRRLAKLSRDTAWMAAIRVIEGILWDGLKARAKLGVWVLARGKGPFLEISCTRKKIIEQEGIAARIALEEVARKIRRMRRGEKQLLGGAGERGQKIGVCKGEFREIQKYIEEKNELEDELEEIGVSLAGFRNENKTLKKKIGDVQQEQSQLILILKEMC